MILLSFETLLLFLGLAVVLGGVGGYYIRRAEKRVKSGSIPLDSVYDSLESIRVGVRNVNLIVASTGLKVEGIKTIMRIQEKIIDLLNAMIKKQDVANGLMLKSFPKAMGEQGKMTNDFYSSVQGQLSDLKKMVSKALKVRAESSKKGKKK